MCCEVELQSLYMHTHTIKQSCGLASGTAKCTSLPKVQLRRFAFTRQAKPSLERARVVEVGILSANRNAVSSTHHPAGSAHLAYLVTCHFSLTCQRACSTRTRTKPNLPDTPPSLPVPSPSPLPRGRGELVDTNNILFVCLCVCVRMQVLDSAALPGIRIAEEAGDLNTLGSLIIPRSSK